MYTFMLLYVWSVLDIFANLVIHSCSHVFRFHVLVFGSFIYVFFHYFIIFLLCSSLADAKPGGASGIPLAPIPAWKEDFLRIKMTSFDKLIERTCSSIKNVRLCSEPDQKQGGSTGTSGVAPDAA